MLQIMHITFLCASTSSMLFKFGCMSGVFYYFLGFFQGIFWGFSSYQSGNTGWESKQYS